MELKKGWNMKVTVVPLVVGALGIPAEALEKRLKAIGIKTKVTELQKTVLIHTKNPLNNSWDVRSLVDTIPQTRNISVGRNQRANIQ